MTKTKKPFMSKAEATWLDEEDPDMFDDWPDTAEWVLAITPPITSRKKLLIWFRCLPEPQNDAEKEKLQTLMETLESTCLLSSTKSFDNVLDVMFEPIDTTAIKKMVDIREVVEPIIGQPPQDERDSDNEAADMLDSLLHSVGSESEDEDEN